MKKFFWFSCDHNADSLVSSVMVCVHLYVAWLLIMSGYLWAQIVAVLFILYTVITTLIGIVRLEIRFVRLVIAKKQKKSAPTEVSADSDSL